MLLHRGGCPAKIQYATLNRITPSLSAIAISTRKFISPSTRINSERVTAVNFSELM